MKKTLLLILSVCFLFAAVGCSSGTDYSSDIDRLNAQIEQLQSELNALKEGNSDTDALKEQIEQLQEQITALQQENATLEENLKQTSEELTAKAEALQTELTAATARLTALEAVVNTEPVVCDFGDTYTLSNNGIDLFSIKFDNYIGWNETRTEYSPLFCTITNYSMPSSAVSNYISAYAKNDSTEFYIVDASTKVIDIGTSAQIDFLFFDESESTSFVDTTKISYIYFGISTGAATDSTMIPFAILRMNGTRT